MTVDRQAQPPRGRTPPAAVELHIEELVLHGFAPGDRLRIARAVERELAQLLAGRGAPEWLAQGGEIAQLDGGEFTVRQDSRPEQIGAQVAQAVVGGLER